MNTNYDRLAAQVLRRQSDAVEAGPDAPELRNQLVSAIDDAIAANASADRRDTRPLRAGSGVLRLVLAAAAALLLVGGVALWLLQRTSPDATREAPQPAPLELAITGGGRLVKGPSARVDLSADGAVATLRMGEVAAEVFEQELRVDTTDAQIFVRQAKVSIETGAGCDGRVRVTVREGSARVKVAAKEVTLGEGDTWPVCPSALRDERPETPGVTPRPTPGPRTEKPMSLDEQNELFQRAVELQRAGDVLAAVVLLERIVQKAPDSPLAEPALAQELRWLMVDHRDQATVVARRYLKKFPMGAARADAEKLVAP